MTVRRESGPGSIHTVKCVTFKVRQKGVPIMVNPGEFLKQSPLYCTYG